MEKEYKGLSLRKQIVYECGLLLQYVLLMTMYLLTMGHGSVHLLYVTPLIFFVVVTPLNLLGMSLGVLLLRHNTWEVIEGKRSLPWFYASFMPVFTTPTGFASAIVGLALAWIAIHGRMFTIMIMDFNIWGEFWFELCLFIFGTIYLIVIIPSQLGRLVQGRQGVEESNGLRESS